MNKSMVYLQSGGPTTVINSSLYGAIIEAKKHPEIEHIFGSRYGIEGLLNDEVILLDDINDEKLSLLKQTPGSALGSSRHKLKEEDYPKLLQTILKHNIGYVFVNGGNDSMDTCTKLGQFFANRNLDIKVIGIPKTIDNDLVRTDHTPGFASSARYVINATKSIVADALAYKKGKIVLIEVMGRDAGWNAASTDLLKEPYRPDFIYFKENGFDYEIALKEISEKRKEKGHCVVVISEGIELPHDNALEKDDFGHINFEGVSNEFAKMLKRDSGYEVRAIALSIPERSFSSLRSGVDQKEAIEVARFAVLKALEGESQKMVTIVRDSSSPYKIHYELTDAKDVANHIKMIPDEFLFDHTRLSDKFRTYMAPLISDIEEKTKDKAGIIEFFDLDN